MQLKTHQTGPEGQKVRRLLIEEGADIKKEYYVAVADRPRDAEGRDDGARAKAAWTSSRWRTTRPRRSSRSSSIRSTGLTDAQARRARRAASAFRPASQAQAVDVLKKLYACYMETDASLAEINPLILEGRRRTIKALDAKFNFDSQRAVPPPRDRRLPRPRRGRPGRDRGEQVRPRLHPARRQHRLPGQRRRPGDGDDGHDQAVRRRAGQLPRRRRRRHGREGDRGLQDHARATRRSRRSWSTSSAASCAATPSPKA